MEHVAALAQFPVAEATVPLQQVQQPAAAQGRAAPAMSELRWEPRELAQPAAWSAQRPVDRNTRVVPRRYRTGSKAPSVQLVEQPPRVLLVRRSVSLAEVQSPVLCSARQLALRPQAQAEQMATKQSVPTRPARQKDPPQSDRFLALAKWRSPPRRQFQP